MATSRKRTAEFEKLKKDAAEVWGEQREALVHASKFWQEAGTEAAAVAVNDVAPRVKAAFEHQVKPALATGVANASIAATHGKETLVKDVLPAAKAAFESSSLSDLADDPRVKDLVKSGKKLSKKATRNLAKKAAKQAAKHPGKTAKLAKNVAKASKTVKKAKKAHDKSGIGGGGVFLIILGVIGLGALAYAAFQTLRADDELWVADDADKA
ncbi:hypothetical protein [Frondihabitans cladoniiphilus]|uniref:DNA-binding ferritin-like protein (Dps family) n=1 Tax=Frondihabitans cladoniiphilus TaxID=715785 RepID=A0ABP8VZ90_9MICO